MNKTFMNIPFWGGLIASFLMPCNHAAADSVSVQRSFVNIKFDEPVISQGMQQNNYNDKATAEEKGTDLFDITGDAAYPPAARWVDQDQLQLEFAKGTPATASYRLSFRPGMAKYLSGKEMPQGVFEFRPADVELNGFHSSGSVFQPANGAPNGAVIVFPDQGKLKQNAFLAPDAVRYVFRDDQTGREVPGKASRAQVKHFNHEIIDILRKDAVLLQGDDKEIDWRVLTPETPLGRYVIVEPEKPLPHLPDGWKLVAQTPEGSGYKAGVVESGAVIPEELSFDVSTSVCPTEKEAAYCIDVAFNAYLTQEMAAEAFRNLTIAAGGVQAVNSADGQSKTMQLDGKTVTFSLVRNDEQSAPAWVRGMRVGYASPYAKGFGIKVQGAEMPLLLDIALKQGGAQAAFGLSMKGDQSRRLSLAPAWPQLAKPGVDIADPAIVLPLKGEHKLRLACLNRSKLRVRAARFSADALCSSWADLKRNRTWSTEKGNMKAYARQLAKARKEAGEKYDDRFADNLETKWRDDSIGSFRKLAKRYMPFFGDEMTYEIAAPTDRGAGQVELEIDLGQLVNGELKPGFYIISVTGEPTEEVRAACREIGAPEDLLRDESWYAVQVTDLKVAARIEPGLLVTHLSDGSPLKEGKMELRGRDEPLEEQTADIRDGVAKSSADWHYAIIRSGEDFCVAVNWNGYAPHSDKDAIHVVKDRALYRPGDTVYLRGILRHVSAKGEASLPDLEEATLTVHRPNGDVLAQETVKVNGYGAFDFQFSLPEGEEDVTGCYNVSVGCGEFGNTTVYLPCEVYRRDAFEASLECRADSEIRPKEFAVSVKAKDYNGVPLAGGKVQLRFLLPNGSHEKELRLDDKGELLYTEPLALDYDKEGGEGALSVTGSVCNDREEYIRLKHAGCPLLMADFRPVFQEKDDCILLKKTGSKEKGKILDRDQSVHIQLMAFDAKEEKLPNGFILCTQEETCIWEGDVAVPANSAQGVRVGLLEKWRAWKKDRQPALDRNAVAKFEARDAGGNLMKANVMLWDNERESGVCVAEGAFDSLENGVLKAHATFRHGGKAIALLCSIKGVRTVALDVKAGRNDFALPLEEGECGNLSLAVVLPVECQGTYQKVEAMELRIPNPRKDIALEVKLDPFARPLRPGSKAAFVGVVRTPDGKAAAEAQVTLFAVDAGMLSMSRYRVEELAAVFSNETSAPLLFLHSRWRPFVPVGQAAIPLPRELCPMPGLWNGLYPSDRVGDDAFWGDGRVYALGARGGMIRKAAAQPMMAACGTSDASMELGNGLSFADAECDAAMQMEEAAPAAAPRLRTNFVPVAVWAPALQTDKDGRFHVEAQLPDTLTTYRVYALVLGKDGKTFGNGQTDLTVNQPVMLTPGAPLFMSTGDVLRLPLTITNNTDADGTWQVRLEGSDQSRQVTLKAKSTTTLYFDYKAAEEGERKLRWTAQGAEGADAVEGSFTVVFPAPLLKESHHLVLKKGESPVKAAELLAADLAQSSRGSLEVELSANPLLHLQGYMELALNYPYGCTEQTASALLPWLFYDRLAPFSPKMAETPASEVRKLVDKAIGALLERQQPDGGFAYWGDSHESCRWASSHAGMALLIAKEQGYKVPGAAMEKLRKYLKAEVAAQRKGKSLPDFPAMELYKIGLLCGDKAMVKRALRAAAAEKEGDALPGRSGLCPWLRTHRVSASLKFINALYQGADKDQAFLQWMRAAGHDYRHVSTHDSGWMFFALHEFLKRTPAQAAQAEAILNDGSKLSLGNGSTRLAPAASGALGGIPLTVRAGSGVVYAVVKAKARPERTEYPGLTEKGLQVTRVYEKCGADGVWRPATEFTVGDIVRVSLTCAKADRDLEYFVLEDSLPSCMEAINPRVPGQAAGLSFLPWSFCFDHKEYLADRVRGFCTRWAGRDLLNMSYYARVKRAGVSIAPPAQAQLMYEPQTYGLSENKVITSK